MDHEEKKFYIEIATLKDAEAMTQSALLNLLTFAEQVGAEKVYVCYRKMLENISSTRYFVCINLKILSSRILSQDVPVLRIFSAYSRRAERDLDDEDSPHSQL